LFGQDKSTFLPNIDRKFIDSLARNEQGLPTSLMIDPSLIQNRLKLIQNVIPLIYNQYSHQYVEYFAFKKAVFTQHMLEKRDLYFPIYEKYLKLYGLPDELKYLSLIESGLETKALSLKGAGGLWQFMPYTARGDFGLRVDSFVDERFDPERATEAACKYMRQLYRIFGDWHMALAAYNTGPGNVKRAIRRCGSTNFWGIYNCLPKETRNYVPQYIAISYMMNFHWDHAIQPQEWVFNMPSDTLHLKGFVNLKVLSSLAGFSLDTFRVLNPHILGNSIPSDIDKIIIRIPKDKFAYFSANRTKILDSASFFGTRKVLGFSLGSIDSTAGIRILKNVKKKYVVRKGETIYTIARNLDVSVFELKRINHLRSNRLKRGKLMSYFVKEWVDAELANNSSMVESENSKPFVSKIRSKKRTIYHRVRPGDTLSQIADRYNGSTIAKIKKLNRLRSSVLKPGMKLRIS
jgi:membrane-bound lytic murein transglycosylase D